MSKVRLLDKRRAFCNDTLKISAGLHRCSRAAGRLRLASRGKQQVLQSYILDVILLCGVFQRGWCKSLKEVCRVRL